MNNLKGASKITFREKAKQIQKDIPAVLLALREKDTPAFAKILAGITVAYALSPVDIVPDFIPVIGYLDDIIILPLLISLTIKLIPKDIFESCRVKSEGMWQDGNPKKWYYAIPIVLIWLLILFFIIRAIYTAMK